MTKPGTALHGLATVVLVAFCGGLNAGQFAVGRTQPQEPATQPSVHPDNIVHEAMPASTVNASFSGPSPVLGIVVPEGRSGAMTPEEIPPVWHSNPLEAVRSVLGLPDPYSGIINPSFISMAPVAVPDAGQAALAHVQAGLPRVELDTPAEFAAAPVRVDESYSPAGGRRTLTAVSIAILAGVALMLFLLPVLVLLERRPKPE